VGARETPNNHRRVKALAGLLVMATLPLGGCALATLPDPSDPATNLGAFAPTPFEVVERMLELSEVMKDDVVYDLGSGDGRMVILAAKRYGARGVGIEIDPVLLWFSTRTAKRERVDHLVTFIHADALTVDVSPATVVTLYLTPDANLRLRPILWQQLRPGTRIVSHAHDMGDWAPERVESVVVRTRGPHAVPLADPRPKPGVTTNVTRSRRPSAPHGRTKRYRPTRGQSPRGAWAYPRTASGGPELPDAQPA
jgi:SAM-dependent methyltransferase